MVVSPEIRTLRRCECLKEAYDRLWFPNGRTRLVCQSSHCCHLLVPHLPTTDTHFLYTSTLMFILVGGVLYDRFHTRVIRYYRGVTVLNIRIMEIISVGREYTKNLPLGLIVGSLATLNKNPTTVIVNPIVTGAVCSLIT
jgi:hypothetical protein